MTHYSPGAGLKKPMNMLENPVYPDIKKGPPRFVWSRKHWTVDEGATLRDTEPFTQFYEPAILAQSRDYNRTVYGQSSHRDIVNAEFRPPLLSVYEDLGPLTRIPATIHAIIPHINPSTAGHDGGTSSYTARNQRPSDIEGALTDRIKTKEWRPTFYAPMDIPADNSVLPDLEAKLPPISVHAGWNIPIYITPQLQEPNLGDIYPTIPLQAGHTTKLRIDGPSGYEDYQTYDNRPAISASAGMDPPVQITGPAIIPVETFELRNNRPQVSASAGMNTPIQINAETRVENLLYNRPQVSASAGMNTPIQINAETRVENLLYNRPQVSASAGMNTPIQINAETRVENLLYNRPQVSASAGMNIPIQINAETRVEELIAKLDKPPIHILNPGSESGYRSQVSMYSDPDKNIRNNRPIYSYTVPSKVPAYKSRNEQSHRPYFRERLQIPKSYGQISQSGGAIPRIGLEQRRTSLGGKIHKRMVPKKKQVQYHF